MKHESSITSAIRDSIDHNKIEFVEVPSVEQALDYLGSNSDVSELGDAPELDGDRDVWGKWRGEDFRIRIREAKHASV